MKSWGDRYAEAAQEDRCAPHRSIALKATLRPSGQRSFGTSVIDLSLGGFAAWCGDRLDPQTLCWLTFPGVASLRSEVVWWDDRFVGCAFSELLTPTIYDGIIERYHREGASPGA